MSEREMSMSQVKAFESNTSEYKDKNPTTRGGDTDFNAEFNGAAIIDEQGNEVPITEEMVQSACKRLSNAWLFPRQGSHH